jgi:hypothetical protein
MTQRRRDLGEQSREYRALRGIVCLAVCSFVALGLCLHSDEVIGVDDAIPRS